MQALPRIDVKPVGNLGNQMLQLMLMEALQRRRPGFDYGGFDIAGWKIRRVLREPVAQPALRVIGQHVDLSLTRDLMDRGLIRELEFAALGFRMAHYLPNTDYQGLFPRSTTELPEALDRSLLINVRGAEILSDTHPDYGPLPIAFYRQLAAQTGLPPIFMGQIGADPYSAALRSAFPGAPMLESRGAMGDFELIRSARHVVVSVSTFSWLAAWLSNAETVHVPAFGMLNPEQRPDIDLLPIEDPRYRFYRFPIRHWTGAPQQFDQLTSPGEFAGLTLPELRETLATAAYRLASRTRSYGRRLVWRALLHRYVHMGGRVGLKM